MPRPQMRTIARVVLGTAGVLAVIWYFRPQGPQVYDTVLRADRLVVYEGLPHPMYEERAVREELKTKPTVQLSGFPFYREPLDLKDEDVKTLRGLLGDGGTYRPYTGEKRCGGFHPDYAVEWTSEGITYRCLICFGCDEAKFDGPQGERSIYDLRSEWQGFRRSMKLLDLLKPYRKNRPPHESFGPLAVTSRHSRALTVDLYRGTADATAPLASVDALGRSLVAPPGGVGWGCALEAAFRGMPEAGRLPPGHERDSGVGPPPRSDGGLASRSRDHSVLPGA